MTNVPPRRDTAMLNGDGSLLIAFETVNPGAWAMHRHIGSHTDEVLHSSFWRESVRLNRWL